MLETFSRIKNCSLLRLFLTVLSISFLQAQENKKSSGIEKIYLHTDNSSYFIGEDLWYKAYVVQAKTNLLYDNSNILYVELISPDSKIIARNKTNLEIGLGHGDFKLADSLGIKPGRYQIRAYTNWDRNFCEDFVFKKEIEIFNVFESNSKIDKTQIGENKALIAAIVKPHNIKVDFFPEGGSLLQNTASVLGFKAVDSNGNPVDVKGEIFDSNNELVTSFASAHDGMGKFQIIPIEGKNYYAKIKDLRGTALRIELPKATKKGYLLNYNVLKGKNIISIFTNDATLSQNPDGVLTVVCKTKGISYLEIKQTVRQTVVSFELPKEIILDGISQITLLDSDNKPQSERLVYFEKEHDLEVQLTTNKAAYQPNEKVMVNVSSKSKAGIAKSASFSLSATDTNGVEDKDFGTTISSYFLMESDIRGKVNNPGYYFDTTNSKRLEHLDDLLLTQGWRDFVWKTTPKASDNFYYKVEKGITISGKVKQLFGNSPKINNNMTLALMGKKNHNFFNVTTDSIGHFKFENLLFSGKAKMYLNSRNGKGKFNGEIVLDSIEQEPIDVTLKNETINSPEITNKFVENVYGKYIAYGVKPENVLKEVKVIVEKKNPAIVPYAIPDYTYKANKKTTTFFSVYDIVEEYFPFVYSGGDRRYHFIEGEYFDDMIKGNDGMSLYKIDGYDANFAEVYAISPYEIERIDIVSEGYFGGIYVFTNRYKGLGKAKKVPFHSLKKDLEGFYNARVFYAPDPEKSNVDTKATVRNTLYWNPDISPDATGSANISYYNTKVETKVKVALEGITAAGIPVVKNTYYTIKNQQDLTTFPMMD